MRNKISSYAFWVAIMGAVVVFIQNILKYFGIGFDSSAFESVVLSFCGVLVVLGVLVKDDSGADSSNVTDSSNLLNPDENSEKEKNSTAIKEDQSDKKNKDKIENEINKDDE